MDFKDGRLMSLCLCPSPRPARSLSLTCKWQEDSVMTFDTSPLCFLEGPDNCYGNGMLPRSVDWLILAVSQPDESFDPACLFRSVLVKLLWWHVCRSSVSCVQTQRKRCVVRLLRVNNIHEMVLIIRQTRVALWECMCVYWSFLSSRKEGKQFIEQDWQRRETEREKERRVEIEIEQ